MYLLLTGATGLVGRYLVRDLLRAGLPLAVLVRSQGRRSARERLDEIVTFWKEQEGVALPEVVCLDGDITRPGLGLNAEGRHWVERNVRTVLHNAASLTFVGDDPARDPWLSNLSGTHHLLDFCEHARLRHLHHVSTAYVCGTREGPVLEDELECGQTFRNDYERSKFAAEQAVRTAGFLEQRTVYRPAIIVGDAQTGYTSTYHGLYPYLRFIATIMQSLTPQADGRLHCPFRINLTGQERRNLVPVDWVSGVITHLVSHPEHHGKTYHLTPPRPITAAEIEQATARYFNYYGPHFVGQGPLPTGGLNDFEALFYDAVATYQPYWAQEPTFDCQHTLQAAGHLACPPLDEACMHRLIDFAVRDGWGKRGRRQSA